MKIALDPTPFHHTHQLLEFPKLVAELGYEWIHLTPHKDFFPFYNHPRADDELVKSLKKASSDAGVGICALQPVYRWSGPEEDARSAAVRYWRRLIQIAVDLGVSTINTEFNGRPERAEESERAFIRSLDELLPVLEKEGVRVNIDPHPDDFIEDGHEAVRLIRGLNSPSIGFVYVGAHTFHYGDDAPGIIAAAGERLGAAFVADSYDHHRSHGLRYISNPPGNAARVHQHSKIGDGDVDWAEYFSALKANGFLDRPESILVSNVFGEAENAVEVSRSQLVAIEKFISEA